LLSFSFNIVVPARKTIKTMGEIKLAFVAVELMSLSL
jgi:hypothetical protein